MWKSKTFQTGLQVLVLVLLSVFLLHRLLVANNPAEQWEIFRRCAYEGEPAWLLLAMLLMPVNWLLETLKWKLLLNSHRTAFWECAKGVLAGITFGFITPGRMGEFAGRVYYIRTAKPQLVFLLSSWGGMAQTLSTVATAALLFPLRFQSPLLNGVIIGIAVSFLLLYFMPGHISRWMMRSSRLRNRSFYLPETDVPSLKTLGVVLMLSWVRFGVYVLQYMLAFRFATIDMETVPLLINSVLVLCANSVSPLLPVFDLGWRGSAVLLVFGNSYPPVLLLFAMLLIWLINLALPAMAGFVFFRRKSNAIIHAAD